LNKEVTVRFRKLKNATVGFDVLTTCQPSTVWYSRERLPAAAAQPAQGSSEPEAPRFYNDREEDVENYNFTPCFVCMRNFVSSSRGRIWMEFVVVVVHVDEAKLSLNCYYQ
jgi:hypothetical protein